MVYLKKVRKTVVTAVAPRTAYPEAYAPFTVMTSAQELAASKKEYNDNTHLTMSQLK